MWVRGSPGKRPDTLYSPRDRVKFKIHYIRRHIRKKISNTVSGSMVNLAHGLLSLSSTPNLDNKLPFAKKEVTTLKTN